jgi:hypothetical protein
MDSKIHIIIINAKSVAFALVGVVACLAIIGGIISINTNNGTADFSQQSEGYTILAMNDIGMHCYDTDFSSFLLLPPYNTLKAQVFKKGTGTAELVNKNIEVTYEIVDNTTSADKTNFWEYAKDYGYNVPPNIGITGNGLKGQFKLSADGKYYEATGIPLTPYNDGSTVRNPYQLVHISVKDKNTGKLLAEIDNVVAPVSNEMKCSICHGETGTDLNILKAHDELSGTHLVLDLMAGSRHKCSDCHKDNILGQPGKIDVKPLSQAIHGFHADKMTLSNISPKCYSCHPGPETQCYRGIMYSAGVNCVNSKCHGDMANVAKTQANGRQAWLEEPNCSNCHGAAYAVNLNTLYRNSYLQNSPCIEMNNLILCESCHNSPHAEWKSANAKDNLLPIKLLGYASYINKCTVCHQGSGKIHKTPQ